MTAPERPDPDAGVVTPLRHARSERGLTLKDVSARTGIAFGYISDLERGKRPAGNVSLRCARALSVVLDKPVDALFPGYGNDRMMTFLCPDCHAAIQRRRSTMPDDDLHCPICGYCDEARNFDGGFYEVQP